MGVALFARNRREVRLTEAGTVFLHECRVLLDQFRSAVNAAVHASQANVGSVMPAFLALIRSAYPNVDVLVPTCGRTTRCWRWRWRKAR